jgi:hypothetical protein
VGGQTNPKDIYREAGTLLLDIEMCGTGALGFGTQLTLLKERGVAADIVSKMAYEELAVSLAAHMVEYEQMRLPQFLKLRDCLVDMFLELSISGSVLVGDHAIPADEFFELVVDGLTSCSIFRSIAGHKATLRRFIDSVYGGNH